MSCQSSTAELVGGRMCISSLIISSAFNSIPVIDTAMFMSALGVAEKPTTREGFSRLIVSRAASE